MPRGPGTYGTTVGRPPKTQKKKKTPAKPKRKPGARRSM